MNRGGPCNVHVALRGLLRRLLTNFWSFRTHIKNSFWVLEYLRQRVQNLVSRVQQTWSARATNWKKCRNAKSSHNQSSKLKKVTLWRQKIPPGQIPLYGIAWYCIVLLASAHGLYHLAMHQSTLCRSSTIEQNSIKESNSSDQTYVLTPAPFSADTQNILMSDFQRQKTSNSRFSHQNTLIHIFWHQTKNLTLVVQGENIRYVNRISFLKIMSSQIRQNQIKIGQNWAINKRFKRTL